LKYDSSGQQAITVNPASVPLSFKATFVSSTGALNPPLNGGAAFFRAPRDCVINKVTVLGVGGTGSCVIGIWKDTYGNYPPTSGDSIVGASPPTISAGISYTDAVLSGWSKNITDGDVFAINLDSCSTFTKVTVELEVA
jgi:hypothetical protein